MSSCASFFSPEIRTRSEPSPPPYHHYHRTTTTIGRSAEPARSRRRGDIMSCSKERPGKSTKSWVPIVHLNVGFVASVLVVLLTYLVASQKASITGLNGKKPIVCNNCK